MQIKLPLRTRSRKDRRESSESDLRTERDRQEVSAVTAAREADSIFSLAVWNTCRHKDSSLLCTSETLEIADFLYKSHNKPLCAVMPTSLRETLPGLCVHILKRKQSEKELVCSDKTCATIRGNCVWSSNRYFLHLHMASGIFFFTFYMTQRRGDFSPESAASLTLHSEHLSRAFRWWGVTKTAENQMPQSRATNKCTTVPKRERSTTEWRRWPYLSKLWRPDKNVPQRHNQFLFGDAMGVVRRLE